MAKETQEQPNKQKKKRPYIRNTIMVLCLIIGLFLIFINPIKSWLVNWTGDDLAISHLTAADIDKNKNAEGNFDFSQVGSLDLELVARARLYKDNMTVVGGIAIPEVDLNLPITQGVDNYNLAVSAGTMKADQVMGEGNYALAGHNMLSDKKSLFSPVLRVKEGDLIYLTDLKNVYTYKATSFETVDPSRVDVINDAPGEKLLTLVTCTNDTINRLIVQAELQSVTPVKEAPQDVIKAFDIEDTVNVKQ